MCGLSCFKIKMDLFYPYSIQFFFFTFIFKESNDKFFYDGALFLESLYQLQILVQHDSFQNGFLVIWIAFHLFDYPNIVN